MWVWPFTDRASSWWARFNTGGTRQSKEWCASHHGLLVPLQRPDPEKHCVPIPPLMGHIYTSGIYTGIWLAKKISTLRLTGAQLTITERFSPGTGMSGFPHSLNAQNRPLKRFSVQTEHIACRKIKPSNVLSGESNPEIPWFSSSLGSTKPHGNTSGSVWA